MADNPRIEELRRRILKDPASIAFAQLGEEYRRAGSYEDAIATCRAGLAIHPGYLSARVTLGRALLEVNDLDAAQTELACVLKSASENLAAIRGIAEIHHRRGELSEALRFYKSALALARHDPDLEQASRLSRRVRSFSRHSKGFPAASRPPWSLTPHLTHLSPPTHVSHPSHPTHLLHPSHLLHPLHPLHLLHP